MEDINKIKISIIVPCYNQGNFISETLDSVKKQTFHEWECIVIDDGSIDNTRDIVNKFCENDKRIKYIYQKNSGVSAARNNGISIAKGEFILPLDADDLIGDSYIEKALKEFNKNPELKLVYCNARMFGAVNKNMQLPKYDYNELLWKNLIFCSAIYRKSDFAKTKGYDSKLPGFEDWDFWLTFLKPTDEVYCIDEILFFYRIKEKSRNTNAIEKKEFLQTCICLKHEELYKPFFKNIINYHNKLLMLENIEYSLSYKIGHLLLSPMRIIKIFFSKEN